MKLIQRTWTCVLIALFGAILYGQDNIQFRNSVGTISITRTVTVDPWENDLRVAFPQLTGPAEVYIRRGSPPTKQVYDYRELNPGTNTILINDSTTPRLLNGTYYVTIFPVRGTSFVCRITTTKPASQYIGMGARPYNYGTSFRVWAPFATSVSVAGEFNGWNGTQFTMLHEGSGYYSINYRGAFSGQQYRYVIKNGGNTLWKNDPYAKRVTNSNGNSIIHNPSFSWNEGNYATPSWDNLVLYEMHAGTFNDAPGGAPGTFDTAINRLDSLQELGVNALLVMPPFEFPGDYSWGYNPSHPFAIESAYGGPDAFKRFVNAAHSRGMAVLIDVVHNHWGPTDLDLWRFDGWSEGNFGGIYFYQDTRSFTPWGNTRPDYGRPEVRQYIRDNVKQWLQEFRADGIRWDSVLYTHTTNWGDNPQGWLLMQEVNNDTDATQPWKLMLAEDLTNNHFVTKPTNQGGAGFDTQWDPNVVHPMRPVMTAVNDGDRNMNDVLQALLSNFNGNPQQRVIYTESHDEVANGRSRVPQEIDPGNPGSYWARKRSTLGAAVVMTAPGIPMIFQGQEFLEDGYFRDDDPLDWTKATTYAGVRNLYRDLIRLRRNWADQTRGLQGSNINVFHVNHGAKVVAYHRWKDGGVNDDVVVLLNFSNTAFSNYEIGLPRTGWWRVALNSDWSGYGADYGNTFAADVNASGPGMHGLPAKGGFNLGPYTALILRYSGN
ncbi:MAG: alpha amylase C-terminal domain-containing protein [Fimbriimonadaceae bacterium]|nr:alpha amylase C-terminal domain-containing protein [Fimbriimonadaceae bacterium]